MFLRALLISLFVYYYHFYFISKLFVDYPHGLFYSCLAVSCLAVLIIWAKIFSECIK